MVYMQSDAFVFSQTKSRLPIKSCVPECFGFPAAQAECFHDFHTPEALFQLFLESCQLALLSFSTSVASAVFLLLLPHADKVQLNQVCPTAFLTAPTKALELDGPAMAHAGLAVPCW